MRIRNLAFLAALILANQSVSAQEEEPRLGRVQGAAGGVFLVGLPRGEFGQAVDRAYGAAFHGHYNITRNGMLRIRGDLGFMQYGSESREACFSNTVGCRVKLDVTTSNHILFGSLGPELVLPLGFAQPYVNGGIGLSYFGTASSVSGIDSGESMGQTTNFDDAVLAFTGGAGVYVPIHVSEKVPFAIDISARYHRNGVVRYLREGDIRDNADGSISFEPRRTEADMITLQVGATFAIRGKRI